MYLVVFLVAINLISVFFDWVNVYANADINLYLLYESFSKEIKTIKGIETPGGYLGIMLAITCAVFAIKNKRHGIIFSLAAIINGIGYAMGWFINKSELISKNIFYDLINVKIVALPQLSLIVYLTTAVLLSIAQLFIKPDNFQKQFNH